VARFNVVVPKNDGGVELYPMKEWLRQHSTSSPRTNFADGLLWRLTSASRPTAASVACGTLVAPAPRRRLKRGVIKSKK
jgi:hypothetical protein